MAGLAVTINHLLARYGVPAVLAAAAKVPTKTGETINPEQIERVILGQPLEGEQGRLFEL